MNDSYHSDEAWSFGDKKRIKEHNPNLSTAKIDDLLNKNEIYTRFRPHRKANRYSPIYVYKKRELFQALPMMIWSRQTLVINICLLV